MSGTYKIKITQAITTIFTGTFVIDITQLPNIIAFYEDGNPNNILAPVATYGNNDNAFISKTYPFSPSGTCITTMSYYGDAYGLNTENNGYNFYSEYQGEGYSDTKIYNFRYGAYPFVFTITEGPLVPPFPRDTSIPPPCFYNMQGLSMYLNQNVLYKTYYTEWPQFPYLTFYADKIYPDVAADYNVENVPLSPLLANLSQGQARQYDAQLALFRKVYEHNYNAYIAYLSQPSGSTAGPRYYSFADYKELNNYKAGLQLVNRIYPFDLMANGYNPLTGVRLRWIVPFPL
jgi:hypothetical protein